MIKVTKKIHGILQLVKAVQDTNAAFGGQVWWRGQRSSEWKLAPSVFRKPATSRSERSLISRFQYKAPSRHPRVPSPDRKAEWLFLMQHYRLPTRLLDWTESPLIASYFAAERDPAIKDHADKVNDTDGALFALSPYGLNEIFLGRRVLQLPHDEEASRVFERAFEGRFGTKGEMLAVRPAEVDARLMVQLSVFTLHDTDIPLDDLDELTTFLLKFEIPAGVKIEIRKELKELGIRESSIFPDLEHLASDVASVPFKTLSAKTLHVGGTNDEPPNPYSGEESS